MPRRDPSGNVTSKLMCTLHFHSSYDDRVQDSKRRSRTAEGAAALRAAGAHEKNPDLRNPDTLAERLIGAKYALATRIPPLRAVSLWGIERRMPGLYSFVTARTKHLDDIVVREIRSGARQVVILGAGLDSRAYRLADQLDGALVVEIDHPTTGQWKRERLRRVMGAPPEHVRYLGLDFRTQTLDDADLDRTLRSVFVWEGVTPYLEPPAVAATLESVARFAPGSSIVFDYWHHDVFDDPCPYPEGPSYIRDLARRGEPAHSGLDPATIAQYLKAHGLVEVDTAGPAELTRRHLPGTRHPSMSFSTITHARR